MKIPLVQEITYTDPAEIFLHFAADKFTLFLDSANYDPESGRYSYIAVDPFSSIVSKNRQVYLDNKLYNKNPFSLLKNYLSEFKINLISGLPDFQGGAAGYFGYDLCRHLEKISFLQNDDLNFPDLVLGFYDIVIAYDHLKQKTWIISTGFPEKNKISQEKRAKQRLKNIVEKISQKVIKINKNITTDFYTEKNIESNFTQEKYIQAVQKCIEYIYAGDIFEVNLSQRFSVELSKYFSPIQLYQRLRQINPAPFAAYFNFNPEGILLSASPERFLKLSDYHVQTCPIKGTRPRGKTAQEDQYYADQLAASEKDRAENIMIVDLLRNDLSKVCEDESIIVPVLCTLKSYTTVHHLVSEIRGKLCSHYDAIDLLTACFPGGSITGAPKIRAMQIIAELEPAQRGPYCGSMGYIAFNSNMDTSIIIRTYAIRNNKLVFQAGGAIVADSDPQEEYNETLIKASALRKALLAEIY